ncbi:MAG: ECF-type sigma factor [Rhodanobacteraceae bacterium]
MGDDAPLTDWLRAAGSGDTAAGERAYTLIYDELRRIAACQMTEAGRQAMLTPTAVVHEAFLRLAGGALAKVNDREHFFNLAARGMRQTVIDHARERLAQKRGGDFVRTDFDDNRAGTSMDAGQVLDLERALAALDRQDARLAQILSWRVFAGLSTQEIAELQGRNERTVQRDLVVARNYLRMALSSPP